MNLKSIEKVFYNMSVREKTFSFLIVVVLIYWIMSEFFIGPNFSNRALLVAQWQAQKNVLDSINVKIFENKIKLPDLNFNKNMINSKDMIEAFEQFFSKDDSVKIISFSHVAVEMLGAGFYKQKFKLTFESTDKDALSFLAKMKHFGKPFFLESVLYNKITVSESRIVLVFYSISETENLLEF